MLLEIVRFILLLPFRLLDVLIDAFIFPRKMSDYERQELIKNQKIKQMRNIIYLQANQFSAQRHQLQEMDRLHNLEIDQLEMKYRNIIRDLQRDLNYERMRKASRR